MSAGSALLLAVAGIASGLAGSIAGLASLFSYPALPAAGLPPVAANVTNTVALFFNTAGTAAGSREELRGQGRGLARLALLWPSAARSARYCCWVRPPRRSSGSCPG
ncbi:hypothetical protein ACFV29_29605 [Streptomyces sp. NPDC059690]|uniref:hypothetical protein n=1 Tax=Streptomyces sp. NPDC059690 TaxID=3346907 RepID=UPI0036C90B2F